MPKPSIQTTDASKKSQKQTTALQTYTYPTVGNGISVRARSQEEADALVAKLRKDSDELSSPEKSSEQ